MASQDDPSAGVTTTFDCQRCSKTFSRSCDLNKHEKSHSRPYKCKDKKCKYHTLGWPTAKELERHCNDKHSIAPRTFRCWFQPCSYLSKRESNCKQHMEKAHGWDYVKSKSRGNRRTEHYKADGSSCSPTVHGTKEGEQAQSGLSAPSRPLTVLTPATDFVLFDDHADSLSDDEHHPGLGHGDSQSSESYLPWTSPGTRLRNNELFIEQFSQAYDGTQTKSEVAPNTTGLGMHQHRKADVAIKLESPIKVAPAPSRKRKYDIDEDFRVGSGRTAFPAGPGPSTLLAAPARTRLPVGLGQSTFLASSVLAALPIGPEQPILSANPALADLPIGPGQPILPPSPALAALPTGPGQPIPPTSSALATLPIGVFPAGLAWTTLPVGPGPSTLPLGPAQATLTESSAGPHRSQLAEAGLAAPALFETPSTLKHQGSISNDNGRPQKKLRLTPAEDFTDTTMPDIFRHAHPQIYDNSQADKFSSCHTPHREISTLVRHLSRPAHRLAVTERTISSFDVEDANYKHPKAGLCRSCWHAFDDRAAFAVHVSSSCQRVSKGKREKWRILSETFTPLLDSIDAALPSIDATQGTEEEEKEGEEGPPSHLDGSSGFHDHNEAGTPPTSVPSPIIPESTNHAPFGRRAGSFVAADEYDRLQQEHQALFERHQQLERMAQVLLVQRLIQTTMMPAAAPGPDVSPPTLFPSTTNPSQGTSDRESLIQHMDSRFTDVDVRGFMAEMEDNHQSTSGTSSLSSSSRSTINRVPPSPPSRPAELPGSLTGGPPNQQDEHPPAQAPPPPSIPDSGYGTENRRGSLGDVPKATTGPGGFGPTPPSTAEMTEQSQKPGEEIAWNNSLSQGSLRAMLPSPQHSQQKPTFLTDQEMADYMDPHLRVFYPNLGARPSPPGFVFDSQSGSE